MITGTECSVPSPAGLTEEFGLSSRPDPLGVGLMFNPSLPAFLDNCVGSYDYLEIIPDTFWTDHRGSIEERFREVGPYVEVLERTADRVPVVAHHLGLSLGTEEPSDPEYLDQLCRWWQRFEFPWHSDHLSVARVPGSHRYDHAGVAIPVPFDDESLDVVAATIGEVQAAISAPFLVENSVYFLDIPEQQFTEPQFMNALTARTGCGLLLDLHNLYANARNHRFDAFEFLAELDLSRVVEIHVAGGSEFAGMWTDSHSGPCPEPVWQMLDWVLPRAPALCGITFEFHHSYYPALGEAGIAAELDTARSLWDRHRGLSCR